MPIKQVIEGRVPIKMWSDDIDEATRNQLSKLGGMPFIYKHLAVMPDVHLGKGSTIGSVVPTKNAIIPACVGVDIGCGMLACKLPGLDVRELKDKQWEIFTGIENLIPTGMKNNGASSIERVSKALGYSVMGDIAGEVHAIQRDRGHHSKISRALEKTLQQMGTLGGGNHFIEICESEKGDVWLMLHSGSRGVGNLIAQHHISVARDEMKRMFIDLPDPDLAYFVEGKPDFEAYMHDMQWAQLFAKRNRSVMAQIVIEYLYSNYHRVEFEAAIEVIDCHHNYVEKENHFGSNVWITRKGAVRARTGDLGIIPGSMGARSFIVRGLGNPQSFNSCSHGAGRTMSRGAARKAFQATDVVSQTMGVACDKTSAVVDEIPGSYKDIDAVMANQSDLVEIVETLKQFVCVKGVEKGH
jgi:tRNA-splicing ligase RtcB